MKTTEYLYGIQPHILREMPYYQALEFKKESAMHTLKEVTKEADKAFRDGGDYEKLQSLHYRQKAILDAIDFTEKLLDEMDE